MNRTALALIFAASIMLPASAPATVTIITANLEGTQEVPPNASPASGIAQITVDDVLFTMHVEVSFAGLIGNTTASHIHCCTPAGLNVGVASELPSFTGFPLGVQSGTYDHTFDMTDPNNFSPVFLAAHGGTAASAFADLLAGMSTGNAYLNIHSTQFPGGEIRGQLAAIPEPSTWAMMLFGFGAVGMAIRRSRKLAPVSA